MINSIEKPKFLDRNGCCQVPIKEYNRMIVPSEFGNSPQEINRKQAQRFFLWFMESINCRTSILQEFIIDSGEHISLDYSPVSLIGLWGWFENYIEIRNMTADEVKNELKGRPKWFRNKILEDAREISDFTLTIGLDIAIYFAETFRKNREGPLINPKAISHIIALFY